MNTTELLKPPVDRQLLGLLELPEDLPEQLSIAVTEDKITVYGGSATP